MKFRKMALAAALCLGMSATATLADNAAPCQLHRIAALDIHYNGDTIPAIPVTVAGQQAFLTVDMDSTYSALSQTKAKALGLTFMSLPSPTIMRKGDGTRILYQALAPSFMIGRIPLPDYTFVIFPDNSPIKYSSDGVLGVDVLSIFDVELDFGKNKFNLFSPSACGDNVVYWNGAFARLPIAFGNAAVEARGSTVEDKHINISGKLDGADVRIGVDPGRSDSVMTLKQAEDSLGWHGLPAGIEKHAPMFGHDAYVYTFKTLTLGGITLTNIKAVILDSPYEQMNRDDDMALGMDTLRRLHLYVSYAHKTLYVSAASAAPDIAAPAPPPAKAEP